MNNKKQLLYKFRKLQTVFSVILFFFILIFFLIITKLDIREIQISHWGILENYGWIFNYSLIILSLTTFFNAFFYIKNHNRIISKKIHYLTFGLTSLFLFLVGFFPLNRLENIHNIFAFLYFFSYPLSIFLLSHTNRKQITYKEWFSHLMTSSFMIVTPLTLINFFNGMAISEIAHTLIVMFWNIKILIKIN
jgi:hypothetical protein